MADKPGASNLDPAAHYNSQPPKGSPLCLPLSPIVGQLDSWRLQRLQAKCSSRDLDVANRWVKWWASLFVGSAPAHASTQSNSSSCFQAALAPRNSASKSGAKRTRPRSAPLSSGRLAGRQVEPTGASRNDGLPMGL